MAPEYQQLTYRWKASVVVELPMQLGGERRVFDVEGQKTFGLRPTDDERFAALRLVDQRLTVPPTQVAVGRAGWLYSQLVSVPQLTLGPEAIDLEGSEGFVDLETGWFTLQYRINLAPDVVALLRALQMDDVPVVVQESGQMELRDGGEFQSWLRFVVAPDYPGEFIFHCFGGKCKTATSICATLDGSTCREVRTVLTCPGHSLHLFWSSSDDVTQAEITPDVGSVGPNGTTIVNPSSTTDYTIKVKGECSRQARVHVVVVQEGTPFEISAHAAFGTSWPMELDLPTNTTNPQIRITSIAPSCGLGCFVHEPPLIGLDYLACGQSLCNGLWACRKIDPDGFIRFFNTALTPMPLNHIPLAGTWQFTPLVGDSRPSGSAYFRLTGTCRT